MKHIKPIALVLKVFGGTRATARAIGITPSAVSQWNKGGAIPFASAMKIIHVAKGRLSANDLMFGRQVTIRHGRDIKKKVRK